MKNIIKFFTSRVTQLILAITLQTILFIITIYLFSFLNIYFFLILTLLNIIVVIYIINHNYEPSYRLLWILVTSTLPLAGSILYIFIGGKKIPKSLSKFKDLDIDPNILPIIKTNIDKSNPSVKKQLQYVVNHGDYPVYNNTNINYYSDTIDCFNDILIELKNAKDFIFIEFFIIDLGYMYDSIFNILKDKTKQGIKVYLMYDDGGCINTLPYNYHKYLIKQGINCRVFNPLKPKLHTKLNNRNHRKIIVIDNHIAYMGSFNIGDEYINRKQRFGYWKDTSIKLQGEAVYNCTYFFIQFYNTLDNNNKLDYNNFNKKYSYPNKSLVLPFSDSPSDSENLGHNIHYNIISNANKYVYIHTPYLILNHIMLEAIKIASKNNVEIIITTPKIPDKQYVKSITKNKYDILIKCGVKIYEYLPGFIHSKLFLSDDKIALIGTINTDYRSYFLNFECGVLINEQKILKTIKKDYINTIKQSKQITLKDTKVSPITKIYRSILNIFAPLM